MCVPVYVYVYVSRARSVWWQCYAKKIDYAMSISPIGLSYIALLKA